MTRLDKPSYRSRPTGASRRSCQDSAPGCRPNYSRFQSRAGPRNFGKPRCHRSSARPAIPKNSQADGQHPDRSGWRAAAPNRHLRRAVTRLGLYLLALTFVQVGELRAMRWDELHESGAVWVVPEVRMKLGVPHVVPLSRQAQAVLKQLHLLTGGSELVLESPLARGKPLSENTFFCPVSTGVIAAG